MVRRLPAGYYMSAIVGNTRHLRIQRGVALVTLKLSEPKRARQANTIIGTRIERPCMLMAISASLLLSAEISHHKSRIERKIN